MSSLAALSLLLGQDTNWDLRNYHLYNPYAFLHGRELIDHHPAGIQSFHNPLLDLLFAPLYMHPGFPAENLTDDRFLPHGVLQTITYPFWFAWNSQTSERQFRDFRMAAAMLALLAFVLRGRNENDAKRFLFAFFLLSYLPWIKIYSIQRYAVILEMLAPLLCVLTLDTLRWPRLSLPLLLLFLVTTKPMDWGRTSWDGGALSRVTGLPDAVRSSALLLTPPSAFLAATFPASRAVWIGAPFHEGDRDVALAKIANRPLYLIADDETLSSGPAILSSLGLERNGDCIPFWSKLAGQMYCCPAVRGKN